LELLEYLQYPWIIRALIASVLVGISCGMLGVFIVLRNMALIGDALSHAILPGIVIAFIVFGGYHLSGFFLGAVLAGLLAAAAITWIQQNLPTKNDAAIGIIFTVMFAAGVIGISILSRNEGVHLDLQDFLFGNILGVGSEDLWLNLLIAIAVVGSVMFFFRYFFITTFQESYARAMGIKSGVVHYYLMLLLSFTVVASLQTVGVILVVAMLVTPSSTALLWSDNLKPALAISAGFGTLSAISGLVAAIYLEIPPGPAMAICAFIFFLVSALVSPKKGYLFQYFRKQKYRAKILWEDILKYTFKFGQREPVSTDQVSIGIERNPREVKKAIKKMVRKGLLLRSNGGYKLTDNGAARGKQLVRAHRLWETWLVGKAGLSEDQIHEDAEYYEHLLNEDILDQIDASLNFPKVDPHGTPIPQKYEREKIGLNKLKTGDRFLFPKENPVVEQRESETGSRLRGRIFQLISSSEVGFIISEPGKKTTVNVPNLEILLVEKLIELRD